MSEMNTTTHSIGDGCFSTGYRVYKSSSSDLISWSQRRCEVCGRFLSKRQMRYCANHSVGSKEYFELNKENYHEWNKQYRETHSKEEKLRHGDRYRRHNPNAESYEEKRIRKQKFLGFKFSIPHPTVSG